MSYLRARARARERTRGGLSLVGFIHETGPRRERRRRYRVESHAMPKSTSAMMNAVNAFASSTRSTCCARAPFGSSKRFARSASASRRATPARRPAVVDSPTSVSRCAASSATISRFTRVAVASRASSRRRR